MKTIKNILFVSFLILLTSCSNDDDNQQGNFPTIIEYTDYTNSVNDKTVTISYNNNNTISQIVLNDNNGTKTKQSAISGSVTSVSSNEIRKDKKRNKEKKDSKKLVRFENAFYICTPQNTEVH